jgi:large subunit ribosomal protein L23
MPSQRIVYLPELSLTLVRRVSARLPYNHFLFRTDASTTKHEVKEYLEKVYNVKVARITTSISLGKVRRAPGKAKMFRKLKDYKRVMVRIMDEGEINGGQTSTLGKTDSKEEEQVTAKKETLR